jgi:hypothetical protein
MTELDKKAGAPFNCGQAAVRSGVSAKTIRHGESPVVCCHRDDRPDCQALNQLTA